MSRRALRLAEKRPLAPSAEHQALAAAWLHYSAGKYSERDPEFEAWDRLEDLVFHDPETGWAVIDLMWRDAADDRMLATIAAGPVEDLLVRHGDAFIDRVYLLARREPRFRKLLGAVWRNGMSEPVWQKLQSIAGPSF